MVVEGSCDVMYSRDQNGPRQNMPASLNNPSEAYPISGFHDNFLARSYGQIQGHRYPTDLGWSPDVESQARRKGM